MIEHVWSKTGRGSEHSADLELRGKTRRLTVLYGRVALALKVCWCGRVRAHANQYAGVNESRACRLLIGRPELGNVLPPFWSFADRIGTAKIQGTAGRGWGFFGFGFGVYPKPP